ncbi:MAG TPA: DNA polymerase III subunit gamma/tau [Acholeplasma sp.]|nr:DNA polymerase III subunit gamma/tau [Acholeplasma sp.]
MSYVALYRTYRPQNFTDMSGQEVIVKTIQNAVKNNKIGHAYVFSGPRGTGKTSLAKIFAKAINCSNPIDGDPCNTCDACINANSNAASDIIEIDGASNNGVDEIRDLRDKVKYLPSVGKYKVYIIDEVHMLTTGAFNALLKTLEEPPSHVIFILATTEVHKIPATILSRCQRFDFKNIEIPNIIKRLEHVVKEEKIEIEGEAISLIAKNARGGLRDALSLLDQAISFSDGKITTKDVNDIVGAVSKEDLVNLLELINSRNITEALELTHSFINQGKEEERLINDLIYTLRDLLLTKVNYQEDEIFNNLKRSLNVNKIYHFLDILIKAQNNMKFSVQKQIHLEIAIIEMIEHEDVRQIDLSSNVLELRAEIEKLKSGVSIKQVKKNETKRPLILPENIENVLYEATNQDKDYLIKIISNSKTDKQYLEMAENLLKDTEVVAVSLNSAILTTNNLLVANELMQIEMQKFVLEIFNQETNKFNSYYVILNKDWEIVRSRYVELFKNGQKRPKIGEYDFKIYEVVKQEVNTKKENGSVALAKEYFGEDIVKIKE